MKYPLLGRPPKLTQQQVLKAIELKNNQSSQNVASRFGVGRSTLLRHIAKQREKKSA
ncbi:helix-turn-helix domain-containing protein [Aliarcobacter cryaerophilus]|uniref:helix-turn-helix domain-containing protein n=1 Tax=Aliarcobacter cryaerophilus TaxID=28198 RepID=UPI003DA3F98E